MKNFSPETGIKHAELLTAVSRGAGTVNGTGVSFKGCGDLLILLKAGTNQATGTHDVKLQSSDAVGGTYADITGAVFTQITTSNDEASYLGRIKAGGYKEFVRAVSVVATAACVGGVNAFGMAPQDAAQADTSTGYVFAV